MKPEDDERSSQGDLPYRAIVENSLDAIALVNRDASVGYASPSVTRVLGYSPEELQERSVFEFIHPDDRERSQTLFAEALENPGVPMMALVRCVHRDGSFRLIEVIGVNRFDDPEVGALIANYRDVGEGNLAQQALRRSEARQTAMIEAALDAIVTIDGKGNILEFNASAECTFGYSRASALGRPMVDLIIPPALRERHRRGMERYLATGETVILGKRLEMTAMRADGSEFPVELTVTRVPSEGLPVFSAHLRDISDRQRAETALRESEERFRVAAQISSDLIYEYDLTTGNVLLLHETAGTSAEEIPRSREAWEKILHPEDRVRVLAAVRRTLETDHPFFEEYRVVLAGGAVRVRAGYGKVLRDPNGRAVKWLGVNKDLTERRHMEMALRDSEARYRQLFERNLAGLYRSTVDGRILDCNETFARMYGYDSREEILTVDARALYFSPKEREDFLGKLEEEGVLVNYELRGRRKDGSAFWLLENVTLDRSRERGILAGTLLDITDRKEAEDEVKRSHEELRKLSLRLTAAREEERSRIAREIHDELGQKLTVLKMAVARLRRTLPRDPETLQAAARGILASIDELLRTVRDLSTELRPAVLDHLELLDALKWQARDFESRTGIRCRLVCRVDRVTVDAGSKTDLYRVTQEALTNVVRHAGASRVQIQVSREAGDLQLEITDNGQGITEEDLNRHNSLGLLGIRERIQALGGTVRLKNAPEGGMKLRIRIPLAREAE